MTWAWQTPLKVMLTALLSRNFFLIAPSCNEWWVVLTAGDGLAFTLEERVRLWRGHVPHDWFWVYDRCDKDWECFQRELEACITRDGFELESVGLLGPDYINKDESLPWNSWGYKSMITNDVRRPASFLTSDILGQLRECEAWERVVWNYSALTQLVRATVLLKDLPKCKDPQYLQMKCTEEP